MVRGRKNRLYKMFGISYTEMEAAGVMMPLINLTCHYGIPAKYEDVVVVETRATKLSAAKMVLYYEVKRKSDGVLLGSGTTEHGFVDSKTFKPINVKKSFPNFCENFRGHKGRKLNF